MIHEHEPGAEQDPNRPILFDGCEVCESRTNLDFEYMFSPCFERRSEERNSMTFP